MISNYIPPFKVNCLRLLLKLDAINIINKSINNTVLLSFTKKVCKAYFCSGTFQFNKGLYDNERGGIKGIK